MKRKVRPLSKDKLNRGLPITRAFMGFIWKIALFQLLIAAFFLPGIVSVMQARAELVGVVCISDASSSSCDSPPSSPGVAVGSLIVVAVNIQGADSINAFDIYVKTDRSVLNPLSTDLSGTVLGTNIFLAGQCINDSGSGCGTYTSGPGVVRVAAVALGTTTTTPTTGRLFSITYNVTSLAPGSITFQTGCSPSSTPTNACVLTVLGYEIVPVVIVPDTAGQGDFAFVFAPGSQLVVPRGEFRFTSVTIASVDGFSGGVSLLVEITRRGPYTPLAFFLIYTPGVFLLPGAEKILVVEVAAFPLSPIGEYTVTVTGTSGPVSHSTSFSARVSR